MQIKISMLKAFQVKTILFIVLIFILVLSQFVFDVASYFNPEKIQGMLARAGSLAPIVYVLTMALAVVVTPIPSLPLDVAAGAFFGPFLGTLYSSIGALGGAVISFAIARFLGREFIERFLGGHINFCMTCSDKLLTKIVFFSRLIPVVSFDIISYGAGLTKMSLRNFSLATFLGMLPLTFIYNTFGSVLVVGKGLTIIFGFILVLLFFLIPRWIEEKDLFSMGKVFQHGPPHPSEASEEKGFKGSKGENRSKQAK
jgi:uncharacterized membrane protein YdjX (TVP38/TMEM64 family)